MRAEQRIDFTVDACHTFKRLFPFDGGTGPPSRLSHIVICRTD
ncbi:hypothetical protein CZ774_10450 [Frigoribacterium sp. JB110]|nr:hypothetical protein CZ774_10450 [Frigoribacterium sp. JB110]